MPESHATSIPSKLDCSTCGKTYSSSSHLRRHEVKHTGRQSIYCPSCSKSFFRTDVARRHIRKCTGTQEVTIPLSKRGSRPRSCDQCSRRKVSCNLDRPCTRCCSSNLNCSYDRIKNVQDAESGSSQGNSAIPVGAPLLLNYTNPGGFGTSEALSRYISSDNMLNRQDPIALPPSTLSANDDEFDSFGWPTIPWFGDHVLEMSSADTDDMPSAIENRPLSSTVSQCRVDSIISCLRNAHRELCNAWGDNAVGPFDDNLARSVFTAENVEHFTSVFFSRVQAFHPVLHPPTFDAETVGLPLLVSVICMASLYSAPSDHALSVRGFFESAEEYIFNHAVLRDLLAKRDGTAPAQVDDVQAIQAAMMIRLVQMGINDAPTQRRIRVYRHPVLNSALRLSGIIGSRHAKPIRDYQSSEWNEFIRRELAIRLVHWTHLNNSFMACCFNVHPILTISELTGDLPCTDQVFEARTSLEFQGLAALEPVSSRPPSLARSIDLLLQDSWPGIHDKAYEATKPPELFAIISSLCAMINIARSSGLGNTVCNPMLRACERWRRLWNDITTRDAETGKRYMFSRYALESCRLTEAYLKAIKSGDLNASYMRIMAVDTFENVNQFIKTI